MSNRLFEQAFVLPFKVNRIGSHIWDFNNDMVAQFEEGPSKTERDIILDRINGDFKMSYFPGPVVLKDGFIIDRIGREILQIRGWGHLTGTGGLNLTDEAAADIQDDLAAYIVEQLNKK